MTTRPLREWRAKRRASQARSRTVLSQIIVITGKMDVVHVGRSFLGALGVALVAAACGDSGYQYVENEDLGVFARLPDSYAVFDTEDVLDAVPEDERLEGRARERVLSQIWVNGFDASNEPDVEQVLEYGGREPRGFVQVQSLTREQQDMINVSGLRSLVVGTDPLASSESGLGELEGMAPQAEVLEDEPKTFDGGYHGRHTIMAVADSGGGGDGGGGENGEVTIVDQTAVLDETNSKLYLFVVSCNETCYFENSRDTIEEIVESWTVQEVRS